MNCKSDREREGERERTYVRTVRTYVRMQGELFLATLSLAPFDHERASAPRRRSQLPSGLQWGGEHVRTHGARLANRRCHP